MQLAIYLALAENAERTLASSFRTVADGHAQHPDVYFLCRELAALSDEHMRRVQPFAQRYGEEHTAGDTAEPERLHADGLAQVRSGPVGLLRDLQDLHVLGTLVQTTWTVVIQAAQGLRDRDLLEVAQQSSSDTSRQLSWLNTRMKVAAPQALIAAT
jgi:hypothetical protein